MVINGNWFYTASGTSYARMVGWGQGDNVTVNCLLPGAFDTERLRASIAANAKQQGIGVEQAAAERLAVVPARRFGDPTEFGAACAFLCSMKAGYITGQNLLIDGGAFPGTY